MTFWAIGLIGGAAFAGAFEPGDSGHLVAGADDYFGRRIVDPYRSMESGDAAYARWKAAQADATRVMLAAARARTGFDHAAGGNGASARDSDFAVVGARIFYETHGKAGDALVVWDQHGGTPRAILTAASLAPHGSASFGAGGGRR